MSTGDYETLKRLVLGARSVPAHERAAWLDAACSGDARLRAEVEALLDRDVTPDSLMETGAARERYARELVAAIGAPEAAPDRIGPYRLCERIGEGGMGTVYRAEQDAPLRREVAIKLLRRGFDTAELARRFEAERSTLARMEHPYIARVLDAGAEPRVGPYFVMELVRGERITMFCDRHRLTIRERLELFLLVCEAVQHAHQKGVLHRDLKPSNVLVIREQERALPKIIDFGIARVFESEAAGSDAPRTREAILLGTPEYMSPEQAGASPGGMDTRTDIYSLGVLLYELLAGHLPYRFPGDSPADIMRVLATEEPGRPSTAATAPGADPATATPRSRHRRTDSAPVAEARRTTPQRLRRLLAGDLDAIILKAIRREPAQRYASVERLAEDVRRHLEGRPVLARRGSWAYRAGRFARRHRMGVTAVASVALALVAVATVSAVQSARLARERDRARAAEARALAEAKASQEVARFLRGLFQGANPAESRGATVTARDLLDRGARSVDRDLAGQPALQARMLRELAEVYQTLGLYDQADSLIGRALDRIGAAPGSHDEERAAALELRGVITHDQGELDESEQYHREALALLRAAHQGPDEDVARNLNYLAVTLQARGDLAAAEPLYREALSMYEALFGTRHQEVAWGQSTLGWVLHQQARYAEAESLYRAALAAQVGILGERHPDVAHTLNSLAGVRWQLGDYDESEALWRRALGTYRELYPEGHPAVARAMFNLARVLRARGELAEADSLNRASLALTRTLLGTEHPTYAIHLAGLAGTRLDLGHPEEAERLLRESLALRRAAGSSETVPVAGTEETLALTLIARGRARAAEAVALAIHALSVRLARQGPDHPDVAGALVALGRARAAGGDAAGADSALAAGYALRRRALGDGHPLTVEAGAYLGRLREGAGS